MRSLLARLVLLTLVATGLSSVGEIRAYAVPVTVSDVMDGLPTQLQGSPEDLDWTPDVPGAQIPDGSLRAQSQPAGVVTSVPVEAGIAFSMIGFEAPASAEQIAFRTSQDGRTWTGWHISPVDQEGEEGPDPNSLEMVAGTTRWTEPVWVGAARYLQVAVDGGEPEQIDVSLIDSMGLSGAGTRTEYDVGPGPADAAYLGGPDVVTRAQWGADESLRGEPSYADEAHLAVVHHTAGTNDYTREESAGIVRGIYRFHTQSRGWSDIGYNVLIDRFGTVYEGRAGGLTKAVVGAHAAGFNDGSFGVSVMGNFVTEPVPSVVVESLIDVLAWKFRIHRINPYNNTSAVGGKSLPRIVAHRDVGQTTCPGSIYDYLSYIRSEVAARTNPFDDVGGDNTHWRRIFELFYAGMLNGCADERYCPANPVTRAQTATLLVKALELPPVQGQFFSDVPSGNAHAGAVNALAARGVITGFGDGTFHPAERLTRDQMASVITRALRIEPDVVAASAFTDVSSDNVHRDAITALASSGITSGCGDDRFCPRLPVARDQMASFVYGSRAYWVTHPSAS